MCLYLTPQVDTLLELSNRLGYEFRTVSVILPVTPDIKIEWFNQALFDYFVTTQQAFLNRLSTPAQYQKLERCRAHSDKLESDYRLPYECQFFLNIDQ